MDWQDGQRRLDHYNKWLLDNNRPFGQVYPGYPDEVVENKNDSYSEVPEQSAQVSNETVALKPKKSHNRRIVNKIMKGSEMSKVTKLSQATEIVKASASKADALAKIMEALGVTKSNAFVYYTKATKATGTELPKGEKPAKAKAAKANAVTGTSPAKAKAKVAEIDAVIAGLKASGVKVASPFQALGQ